MKSKGDVIDFDDERGAELVKAWNRQCMLAKQINWRVIARRVVNSPCSRFWVSEERAAIVVGLMLKGEKKIHCTNTKREMFEEIYRRFLIEREKHPTASITALTVKVVNSPAPKFYLTPHTAYVYIQKYRKKIFEARKRKLRHLF